MKPEAYEKTSEFEEDYWWFKGRRRIVFDKVEKPAKTSKGKVLLDIGCGTGITIRKIKGFDVMIGVDVSKEALNYAKGRNCKNLICGSVYTLPLRSNSADCLLMLDVLEHLSEEKAALLEVHRVCKEGGEITVTVPAYQFLWSGEDEVSNHKRRYVKLELRRLIESSRFKIQKLSYFNCFLMPSIYTVILFNRVFNKKAMQESDLKKIPNVLNLIFEMILYVESILLRIINLPFGASLICIASKE